MSIELLPKTPSPSETHRGQPRQVVQRDRKASSHRRWWRRGLLAFALIAILATAAALIPGNLSKPDTGPQLTHTITRGDLLVTVPNRGRSRVPTTRKSNVESEGSVPSPG